MNEKLPVILLVDDNEDDLLIMNMAFKRAEFNGRVSLVKGGDEAIAYLKGDGVFSDRRAFPLPTVILLDLNMPKTNGFEVLEWVRQQPALRRISIIILTASTRAEDVERAFDSGANSFLVKPGNIAVLTAMLRCMSEWLQYNHFPPLNETVKR